MGVDYYSCKNCGETFPDCGDYVGCECGKHWCSDECAEVDGFQEEEDGFQPVDSQWEQETSCQFCRKEDFEDSELLTLALELLKITREDLVAMFSRQNGENK